MAEENFNIVESLQTYNNSKQIHNSKAYKMFAENKVDNFELLGIDKEDAAGTYSIKEKDPKIQEANENEFLNDLLEFGNELKDSDVVTSITSRFPEGWINIRDFGTNIFNTFDKLFSLDPNYERSEIFNKWSDNLENARNKVREKRKDVEGSLSDMVGMLVQDMPAYFVINGILKKSGVKFKHRIPLAFGLSIAMSFHETEEDFTINSEAINNLKHILNILPDTPEDQLMDDLVQMGVGWGSAKIFQGIKPAIKWIKRNVPRKTVSDVAAGTAAGTVLTKSVLDETEEKRISDLEKITTVDEDKIRDKEIPALEIIDEDKEIGDQSSNQTMMEEFYGLDKTQLEKISEATGYPVDQLQSASGSKILSNPEILKMLATKAGEVLPSLKKLTASGFVKKTKVNFNKLAEEGKIGKDWYKRSGENILKYVGGDKQAADQFAQVLAIYSPQKQIPHNTQFAIKAWNRFKSGKKIWEGEILEKAKLPENLNITQENKFKTELLAKYGGAKKVKGQKSTGLELVDLGEGDLMVVRHGKYENIAERSKDLKAHLLLNENVSWSGRKTNSFYGNIMKEIDPSIKQSATIDLWMNRAGGFVNKELKDSPKYNYIESIVATVAKKKNWDIDQAQAAIWVSTKGRFDKTKAIFSEKALKQGIGIRKGGSVIPVKGKEKEFADLRFNTAMNYKITSQDIEKAAINFADTLEDNLAFVSWETVPGKFSKHLNQLDKATPQIKSEYHFKVSQILTDDKGADVIAKKLGILSPGHFEAPGYFKGVSNPSGQTKIATTRIKGAGKDITTMDAPSQELLEKYAALRGIILSQDEIGYHRLILASSRKNANSIAIKFDKEFTPNQFKKFGQLLDKEFGDGHALISKEKGVLVLNTGELQNIEFQKRLKNLAENTIESNTTFMYYKNGNLLTKEVKKYGKSYRDIIEGFQRSDIRQLLRDILTKKKILDKEFSKKYGFDYDKKAFEDIESFIQR